jgi:hypothetical protein
MVTDSAASAAGPSILLAVGLWLAVLAPQWIMLLWGLKHLGALQAAVARRVGWKLLAALCWMAAVLVAFVGTVHVCRDVLGQERLGLQRFVSTGTLVQEGVLIVVGLLLARKRRRDRAVGDLTRSR